MSAHLAIGSTRAATTRVTFASIVALVGLVLFASQACAELSDTVARVKRSVVAVGTFQKARSPAFRFRGTGFALGDGTYIATNAHVLPDVLDDEHREVLMVLALAPNNDPLPHDAKVVAVDRDHDLALLRIQGEPLPALSLTEAPVREGQAAAFTGFPIASALGFFPVTHRALVAAITPVALPSNNAQRLDPRVIKRLQSGSFPVLQLDATAYPGNSGSPLYDAETGAVIGILNMVFVKGTKESELTDPTGISFAVPAEHLRALLGNTR